jgi:hypothetical protein
LCYQLFTAPRPYYEARDACQALKGLLLVPSSADRQRAVEKYLFEDNKPSGTVTVGEAPAPAAAAAQLPGC